MKSENKNKTVSQIDLELDSFVVFRGLLENPVLKALRKFISQEDQPVKNRVESYAGFISELYRHTDNFSQYLLRAAVSDENIYIRKFAAGEPIFGELEECLASELKILDSLSKITSSKLTGNIEYNGFLPGFITENIDFSAEYRKGIADVSKNGYGIYVNNNMFRYDGEKIVPVLSSDNIRLSELFGYEYERKQIIRNTEAFLKGIPAANVLLCGDAGTGKSSTVKAVANEYKKDGLRLLELSKKQLRYIPHIMGELKNNPLKFIIFLDDLSFGANDDDFSTLKAILEGSASAKSDNVIIYATSNRRHIVKESFSDRDGDDIHKNDTMQELLSLSERFGLTVLFSKPDKSLYLEIVHGLAEQKGIPVTEELNKKAEAFALRKGSRSARAAEQFTDSLLTDRL